MSSWAKSLPANGSLLDGERSSSSVNKPGSAYCSGGRKRDDAFLLQPRGDLSVIEFRQRVRLAFEAVATTAALLRHEIDALDANVRQQNVFLAAGADQEAQQVAAVITAPLQVAHEGEAQLREIVGSEFERQIAGPCHRLPE